MWKIFCHKQPHVGAVYYPAEISLEIHDINNLSLARQEASEIIEQSKRKWPRISSPRLVWVDLVPLE